MEFLFNIVSDAVIDTLKLIPFLFLTYLVMEAIEQRSSSKAEEVVQRAGFAGPIVGSLVGAFPQCGFSAAASTLYAAKVITVGTLFSVYLATSDELLPILIAEQASPVLIAKILIIKIVIGMLMGFIIDAFVRITSRGKQKHLHICDLCEMDHCGCNHDHHHCDHVHDLEDQVHEHDSQHNHESCCQAENSEMQTATASDGLYHVHEHCCHSVSTVDSENSKNSDDFHVCCHDVSKHSHEMCMGASKEDFTQKNSCTEKETGNQEHRCSENSTQCHDKEHNRNHDHNHDIVKSACVHTVQVTLFIFLITLVLNAVIGLIGEDAIGTFLSAQPVLSVLASSLVGLIPNCAASIVITELFLEGTISTGSMMAGLLVAAGVGLLVLFRSNRPMKNNVGILIVLFLIGVLWGSGIDFIGLTF